ncbi:MAG: amidohydrolase family protein [Novosphingobium sp.]
MPTTIRSKLPLGRSAFGNIAKSWLAWLVLLTGAAFIAVQGSPAQQTAPTEGASSAILFQNVRVFDGKHGTLSSPSNVLIRGNLIESISASAVPADANTRVIDGGGRVLMPGLIDNHWHATLVRPTPAQLLMSDLGFSTLLAGAEASDTLMRGFTTVRDMGGPVFSLKRAIDQGLLPGPRIYPSGAVITVTSGHGDFRQQIDLPRTPGHLTHGEELGGFAIADSPDEVRMRVREQLMQGASQIKLTAGGGVASPFSPLDAVTFNEDELRAAVEAAENWGTYVCTHSYTPESIQRSIKAGVKCIEHGHLMDEATAKLIAENGIWLSTQPFVDMGAGAGLGPAELAKLKQVVDGTDTTYRLARKYKIKTAFGTDILFSAALATRQGHYLVDMLRWYTPPELLVMATSTNGELLRMSGKRNPYPGTIGVVEQGAYADLLLVDGNPLEDINLVADPAKNFLIIMKDGKIYKDTLNR